MKYSCLLPELFFSISLMTDDNEEKEFQVVI